MTAKKSATKASKKTAPAKKVDSVSDYRNGTIHNMFTSKGRLAPGKTCSLLDSEAANYKGLDKCPS